MIAAPWHREALGRLLARRPRMPHALLVSGRTGIGKVDFARELARSLLCESPIDRFACGYLFALSLAVEATIVVSRRLAM